MLCFTSAALIKDCESFLVGRGLMKHPCFSFLAPRHYRAGTDVDMELISKKNPNIKAITGVSTVVKDQ